MRSQGAMSSRRGEDFTSGLRTGECEASEVGSGKSEVGGGRLGLTGAHTSDIGAAGYAIMFDVVLIAITVLIFNRRNFK